MAVGKIPKPTSAKIRLCSEGKVKVDDATMPAINTVIAEPT